MRLVDWLRIFSCVGLVCVAIGVLSARRRGQFQGTAFVVMIIGLTGWAIGLALSFAGI